MHLKFLLVQHSNIIMLDIIEKLLHCSENEEEQYLLLESIGEENYVAVFGLVIQHISECFKLVSIAIKLIQKFSHHKLWHVESVLTLFVHTENHSDEIINVINNSPFGAYRQRIDLSNTDLVEFPSMLFVVATTLEQLNLGNNQISSLPSDMHRFSKLKILFFGQNIFSHIPEEIGQLPSLQMVSFKSNRVVSIHEDAFRPTITWLILSDNKIEALPSTIGKLFLLRKCMLAGNCLSALPEEMQNCTQIELLRISANKLTTIPDWLFRLPRLSWLAYAGNPLQLRGEVSSSDSNAEPITVVPWSDLKIGERIGEGASGFVHKAQWIGGYENSINNGSTESVEVAVKLFKGDTTSDGLPEHEMKASEAIGDHFSFIKVLGRIEGAPDNQMGLVFPLISASEFKILGDPPSFATVTRDTFRPDKRFALPFILKCLVDIASAAQHLHHTAHLMHGDLYAHNILTTESGSSLLTDFGAASFKTHQHFSDEEIKRLESFEVRAFGALVEDLVSRVDTTVEEGSEGGSDKECEEIVLSKLKSLQLLCFDENVDNRPSFCDLHEEIGALYCVYC